MAKRRYGWIEEPGAIKVFVPDVIQTTNFSCGAAALHAVCSYWGVGMDYDGDYIPYLETNPKHGTLPQNIVWYAKEVGLKVRERHDMTVDELKGMLDLGRPVICAIQAWGNHRKYKKRDTSGHYVVAIGYDGRRLYFEDPALNCKRGYLTYRQFERRWHDKDALGNVYRRYGIVIWGAGRPPYLLRAQKVG